MGEPLGPFHQWVSDASQDKSLFARVNATTRDEHETRDAIQEACLRACRKQDKFKCYKHLVNWLFITARNCWVDKKRRSRRGCRLTNENDLPERADEQDELLQEKLALLQEIILELSPEDVALVQSRWLEDRTLREVAEQYGITISAIYRRTCVVLARLRQRLWERAPELDPEFGEDEAPNGGPPPKG